MPIGEGEQGAEARAEYIAAWRKHLQNMLAKGPVAREPARVPAIDDAAPWSRGN